MTLLRRNFLSSLGTVTPSFDSSVMLFTAEDDATAGKLMAEANENVQTMHEKLAIADKANLAAKKAEAAGETFRKAAKTIKSGGEVSEGAIANADAKVNEVAAAAKKSPEAVAPDIKDSDRATATGESESGSIIFVPAYVNLRKDPEALNRCAESMFTEVGAFFGNVWDSIVSAYDHFCQWIGKYFGTYVRTKSRLEALIKTAQKSDAIRIEQSKIAIKGSDISNFTTLKNASDDEMLYIDNANKISEQLITYKKYIELFVDHCRSDYDMLSDVAAAIAAGQYSSRESAKSSLDEIVNSLGDNTTDDHSAEISKSLVDEYTGNKDGVVKYLEYGRMTGYKRFVFVDIVTDAAKAKYAENPADLVDMLGFKIVEGSPTSKRRIRSELNVDTLSLTQIEDVSKEIIFILDTLIDYQQSKAYLKNKAGIKKIRSATEKLKDTVHRDIGSYDDEDAYDDNKIARITSKSAIAIARKFTKNYSTWQSYITYFDRFVFAIERLCNASLAVHK